MILGLTFLAMLAMQPPTEAAQVGVEQIGAVQIGAGRAASIGMEQANAAPRRVDPAPQLAPPGPGIVTAQPAPDRGPTQQLNAQARSAAAPAGPGRSDKAVGVAEVKGGADVCDRSDKAEDEVCRNAIEKRSAEFAPKPAVAPAAETVLLSSMGRGSTEASSTARKLDNGELDTDVALAIASGSGAGSGAPDGLEPAPDKTPDVPANVQDAVNFTLQIIQGALSGR